YPRDRVVRNQIGRILFLKRQYKEAIAEFQEVCKIDPEDLQAHYNLMLCYQGLGERDPAAREESLYKRFKADEASQFITGEFRQLHPADNNERQSIHEHYSVPQPARDSKSQYPAANSRSAPARIPPTEVGGSLRSSLGRLRPTPSRIPPTEVGGSL